MNTREGAETASASSSETPRRPWVKGLQLLLTMGMLWLLLRHTTLDELKRLRESVAPGYLALTAILVMATGVCGAAALLALLNLHGGGRWRLRFGFDYLYVQALCQLTPAQMAEVALPYVAARGLLEPGQIAAALVVQRMAALLIVVTAALLGAGRWASAEYLWAVAGAVLSLCLLLALLISHHGARGWISGRLERRFGPILAGFYGAWHAMLWERPARLLLHLALMVLRFCLSVAANYAVFHAFSIQVPFGDLAALSALAVLAGLLPVTINGVGVTEGIFVFALKSYGNTAGAVLAACLAGRLVTALVMAGTASVYAVTNPRSGAARSAG